ncbi:MAG: hypothetical protein ABI634_12250 [Acidobacteriota bacterium]
MTGQDYLGIGMRGMETVLAAVALTVAGAVLFGAGPAQEFRVSSLESMVAAERAFAAATREIGVRNGFLTFFAADAVALESIAGGTARVVPARDRIAAEPPPALPLTSMLSWSPYIGQVSGDGALGWLTGPYENRNSSTGAMGRGIYFSVWRRQADGTWKVWLDQGITTPHAWIGATDFRAADEPGRPGSDAFAPLETEIAVGAPAWNARLAPSARVHRAGLAPILGRDAVTKWRQDIWRTVTYHPVHTESSAAGDMAIVIGGYAATTATGAEHGIFARVWQVGSGGRWWIVFETSKAG